MIQANELRIGNLVQWCEKIVPIKSIHIESVLKNEVMVYVEINEKLPHYCLYIAEINPIHLTEEWLIKLGFKKYIDFLNIAYIYDLTPLCGFTYDIETKRVTILEKGNSMAHWIERKIEYVHELQNLYFALRGQELTPLH